jgi:hypothetical protein
MTGRAVKKGNAAAVKPLRGTGTATAFPAPAVHRQRPAKMGSAPDQKDAPRLNIWEVRAASRCSIIGTCLTLGELRKIARKTGFIEDPQALSDYDLHGNVESQMHTCNAVSCAVQKHLDAKFEGAIRKARPLDSDEAFFDFWEGAVDAGLVPGAYWAVVTHPALSLRAEARIYGDIHMISHICGASNLGDARVIAEVRREKTELAWRLTASIAERDRHLCERHAEIQRLLKHVRELEPFAAECGRLQQLLDKGGMAARLAASEKEAAALREENAALRGNSARIELQCDHLRARLLQAQAQRARRAGTSILQ